MTKRMDLVLQINYSFKTNQRDTTSTGVLVRPLQVHVCILCLCTPGFSCVPFRSRSIIIVHLMWLIHNSFAAPNRPSTANLWWCWHGQQRYDTENILVIHFPDVADGSASNVYRNIGLDEAHCRRTTSTCPQGRTSQTTSIH